VTHPINEATVTAVQLRGAHGDEKICGALRIRKREGIVMAQIDLLLGFTRKRFQERLRKKKIGVEKYVWVLSQPLATPTEKDIAAQWLRTIGKLSEYQIAAARRR
jgi:hypothetical protein